MISEASGTSYADYFQNSVIATEVHRRFCMELAKQFPDYSDDLWGITASDSEHGYVVWGGPPAVGPIDGTVVPSAAGGSLPFLPQECMQVLRNIKRRYGDRAWCRYGFVNAFNPLKKWYDTDVIGIDTRDHHSDGRERPQRVGLGDLHEESGSPPRHGAGRIRGRTLHIVAKSVRTRTDSGGDHAIVFHGSKRYSGMQEYPLVDTLRTESRASNILRGSWQERLRALRHIPSLIAHRLAIRPAGDLRRLGLAAWSPL